ncbi:uncharacterized protein LOC101859905 [Aplysia californica]|uniref:Uncharacterized protein LOC101859905 n=1 Tax=Aplysia californica TaxID=6500 RepID=A0ABM0JD01_APLCA|nr:uncharacterized protein LOC101859905 [Aplysia californica]
MRQMTVTTVSTRHWTVIWSLTLLTLSSVSHGFIIEETIPQYACGSLLESESGDIESPLFPEPYPPGVDCFWLIRAPAGTRVHLTTPFFYVEEQPRCLFDYVQIKDGEEGEFGQAVYCGTTSFDYLSTSNIVRIRFVSDVSGQDAGFRIHYEQISTSQQRESGCNMTVVEPGSVTSPGYPSPYPADSVCVYRIQAQAGARISLEFTDFEVETTPCTFDRLEIYDGTDMTLPSLLGTFCGRSQPLPLTSSDNSMTLRLVSDASLQSRGFNVTVIFLSSSTTPMTTSTSAPVTSTPSSGVAGTTTTPDGHSQPPVTFSGCNGTILSAVSNISSPNFPLNYPHNSYCVTRLRSDVHSTFFIHFLNFHIEEAEDCSYDSLTIFGANETAPNSSSDMSVPIRRMCGNDLSQPIITYEGRGLDLVFRSDMSVHEAGYLAHVLITPIVNGAACPDVCQNGGTCLEVLLADGSVDWRCQCAERFTGTLCDAIAPPSCDRVECHNNGVCREENGDAVCVCTNGFTGQFCEEAVTLTEGGALYFTRMASNMSLGLGSSAILECAVSDAQANVMWLFHDRILTTTDRSRGVEVHPGGVVVIPEVTDEHSGRYTCMAVTPGDLAERSMWIELTEPCSLDVEKSPSNKTVREGQAAMFQCYVPDADVMLWRKGGDVITQGPRKRILVNHYLVINPVVETDAGEYTCAARSSSGCFSKRTAYLTVEATGHGTECGRPRARPTEGGSVRISSGREATIGSAPWHVVLREDTTGTTFCGGSLISPTTVLTAAHCVAHFEVIFGYPFHPSHIQIYLGTHHCEGSNGIYKQLKSYKVHAQYNDTYYNNDVALFYLDSPVTYSDDVMPICLEREDFVEELLKPGRLGVVTGCGGRHAHRRPPTHLHEVQVPFVPRDVCQERAEAVNTTFTSGMFCAGYARSMRGDACAGDSGGPYVIEFSGRSILAGIVSWGVGCDRENHYGYYTYAAHYYDWIMEHMEEE